MSTPYNWSSASVEVALDFLKPFREMPMADRRAGKGYHFTLPQLSAIGILCDTAEYQLQLERLTGKERVAADLEPSQKDSGFLTWAADNNLWESSDQLAVDDQIAYLDPDRGS